MKNKKPKKISKYSTTERQAINKELREETPPISLKHTIVGDKYRDDLDWQNKDWIGYNHIAQTVGGKFLNTLFRLDILNLHEDIYGKSSIHSLLRKIATAPNGVISGDFYEKNTLEKIFKKDQEVLGDGTSDC